MTENQRLHHGRMRHRWTDEELDYLRKEYPLGVISDIAEHIGVSDGVIRKKVEELGLKRSPDYSRSVYQNRWVKRYKSERYKNYD